MNLFMDTVWGVLSSDAAERWFLTLLHFVWQGFVVAAALSFVLRRMRSEDSAKRYAAALVALVLCVVIPCVTFALVQAPNTTLAETEGTSELPYGSLPVAATTFSSEYLEGATLPVGDVTDMDSTLADFSSWAFLRMLLVGLWLVVELALGGRLAIGVLVMWRIRRSAEHVSEEWQRLAKTLARKVGLRRVPMVLASTRLDDAATYGFFRSVVIVPASWLANMSPEMVESILAHEFTHIRRHDVWANLLQRLLETVFFFHPAVWWLSKQIRAEREHLCDSSAVALTGDPGLFARTIEAAARMQLGKSRLAKQPGFQSNFSSNQGDDRMSLLNRVNRVLNHGSANPNVARRTRNDVWQFGAIALFVPLLLVLGATNTESLGVEPPPAPGRYYEDAPLPGIVEQVPPSPARINRERKVTPASYQKSSLASEGNKTTLPDYVVEPPDVLLIKPQRLAPNGNYTLGTSDVLRLKSGDGTKASPFHTAEYHVRADGKYSRNSPCVTGLTVAEAKLAINKELAEQNQPEISSLSIVSAAAGSAIEGEHLVGPDGKINLGRFGRINVAGKTIPETTDALEEHLAKCFDKPAVAVDIFAYNSKVYYIVTQLSENDHGDQVIRVPATGNETVLDAMSHSGVKVSDVQHVWLSRPTSSRASKVFIVDWDAITREGKTTANFQIMPGDRLVVSDFPPGGGRHLGWRGSVKKFNRLVEQDKYREAIQTARSIALMEENAEVVQSLRHHAKLLEQNLSLERSVEEKRVAKAIGEIRHSRLARVEVETALNKQVKIDFDETALKEVIASIAGQADVDIVLDANDIQKEGITPDLPVSVKLKRPVSARSALALVLQPLSLAAVYQHEVLRVVGEGDLDPVYHKVYSVSDLLGLPYPDTDKPGSVVQLGYESLIELVQETIDPDSWQARGGDGSISAFPTNQSLVVTSTQEVHERIAGLFSQMRSVAEPKWEGRVRKQ